MILSKHTRKDEWYQLSILVESWEKSGQYPNETEKIRKYLGVSRSPSGYPGAPQFSDYPTHFKTAEMALDIVKYVEHSGWRWWPVQPIEYRIEKVTEETLVTRTVEEIKID